jgi:putative multiple sugar transport system ATP-binding protein
MRGITKTFPGVKALSDVNLTVNEGEIHGIVGENGAGKSTLMKVLSGVYPYGSYEGDIRFRGQECKFKDIRHSEEMGIIIIHQELALVPLLSIAENLFLGNEQAAGGVIDWPLTYSKTRKVLDKVGLREHPDTLITNIGVGKQQLVEIAKALSKDVKLLILDEPTASLNESDSDALLDLLLEFKAQGISSILISHKLNEISKVCDEITVIRDGASIETLDCKSQAISEDRIIKGMVGREMADRYPRRVPKIGEPVLEVRNWVVHHHEHSDRQVVKGVNLTVRKGEVVGISGLMGAGRTELAMSIFGRAYGQGISGEALIDGKPADVSTIQKALANGLAYVTEDRKQLGLVLEEDIMKNITLSNLKGVSNHSVIDDIKELRVANDYRRKLNIRSPNVFQKTVNLSGGNQQKVVLARWLALRPKILIVDEPTRGIDIGSKVEVHNLLVEMAKMGIAVLVISSELPEILAISDRIVTMREGRITGEISRSDATQENLMAMMTLHETPAAAGPTLN